VNYEVKKKLKVVAISKSSVTALATAISRHALTAQGAYHKPPCVSDVGRSLSVSGMALLIVILGVVSSSLPMSLSSCVVARVRTCKAMRGKRIRYSYGSRDQS